MQSIEFLSLEDVLEIHLDQTSRYGGNSEIRDRGLLESAIAQPQAEFGGQMLHASLFEMAAAYMFHIVQNHPFVDGNKRTGVAAALVFLDLNGIEVIAPQGAIYDITISVARGLSDKQALAEFFRTHVSTV
jgi:death-on-curing protein